MNQNNQNIIRIELNECILRTQEGKIPRINSRRTVQTRDGLPWSADIYDKKKKKWRKAIKLSICLIHSWSHQNFPLHEACKATVWATIVLCTSRLRFLLVCLKSSFCKGYPMVDHILRECEGTQDLHSPFVFKLRTHIGSTEWFLARNELGVFKEGVIECIEYKYQCRMLGWWTSIFFKRILVH